jgi:hypothetical protein
MRRSLEIVALGATLALGAAFVVSFAAGLWRPAATVTDGAATDPGPAVPVPKPAEAAVRVEILNAARRSGLARRAMDELRAAGFDVVYYGNAGAQADTSLVLGRSADEGHARAVARRLGIARIEQRPDPSLLLDVTVILGADWRRVAPDSVSRDLP